MAADVSLPARDMFQVVPLPVADTPLFFAIALPGASLVRAPGFPQACLPESGRVASGRGATAELCRASAIGEAAELVSCSEWGTELLLTATDAELGPAALTPEALNGFSDGQIEAREAWNRRYGGFDWRPPHRDPDLAIAWLEVTDAYGGPNAYVPADFALIGRRSPGDEEAVAISDSNGCACHPDVDQAKRAAVLELIERDAAARWWYGRRPRPLLPISNLQDDALATWLEGRSRRTRLYDITTELDVPVVAAASAESDGSDVALGFAASPDLREAASAAATEMVQMEISLAAARKLGAAAGYWPEWRARANMFLPPLNGAANAADCTGRRHVAATLSAVLEACARGGIPLWFADMTRTVIGVPAVRAISPKLCHIKPRLARERLLAPDHRDLGAASPAPENQVPLLI